MRIGRRSPDRKATGDHLCAGLGQGHAAATAPALEAIRGRWPGRLGAYPEIGNGAIGRHTVSPAQLAAQARGWMASGAQIIGGCCGTTAAHIRALAGAVTPAARSD